jgi:hypothetical protein
MAKCRLCKKEIPEGIEYCSDCLDKKQVKSNESYLDSLLNSVKNSSEPVANAYKKSPAIQAPQNPEPVKVEKTPLEEIETEYIDTDYTDPENIDPEDLADFNRFDINEDLEDMIVIGDEELYGRDAYEAVTPSFPQDEYEDMPETQESKDNPITPPMTMTADNRSEDQPAEFIGEAGDREEQMVQSDWDEQPAQAIGNDQTVQPNGQPDAVEERMDQSIEQPEEDLSLEPEEEFDPSLGDLLSGFDIPEGDGNEINEEDRKLFGDMNITGKNPDIEEENLSEEEDDFLSLLNQFGSDDPVHEDVQAISDMLNGNAPVVPPNKLLPSDVGDVFSDALKAVSGLEDDEYDEAVFTNPGPKAVSGKEDGKKGKKAKKSKKAKSSKKPEKKAKTVKGKGLFGKLFGNVVDEEAKKAAAKEKAGAGEAAAAKETKKTKGKKSKKKGAAQEPQEPDEAGKRERPAPGEEKQAADKSKKKEKVKKPKKEKKEIIELIDDYDEVEGRINRLGASIVFLFFGIMVILLLVGTNLFTYSVSIKNANTYFSRHKYTDAYNEVYGIELKDEDIELFDKIETVMFVNKQLNSYNNYFAMKKYPEALDSLLKGLKRYDKYIELATILGISSDLDYVRDQILAELNHVYRLSEKDAVAILDSDSQKDYSVAIYDVVLENLNY